MSVKIKGKDLELWLNGQEIPVTDVTLNTNYDTQDSADTATPSDGKDFEVIRAARTLTINANLYEPDGSPITGNNFPVSGKRYRVVSGTITENGKDYTVGQIFESNGTGELGSSASIAPLGAKVTGKNVALTVDSKTFGLTEADTTIKFDEQDSTDSLTTGDGKETSVSRADREAKITAIMRDTDADLLTSNPVPLAATLSITSDVKITGNLLFTQKNITDKATDMAKVDYTAKWIGAPTEQNLGLPAAVEIPVKVILKRGTSTNKEYLGTGVITSKNPKVSITGLATIAYNLTINGAMTENVAN